MKLIIFRPNGQTEIIPNASKVDCWNAVQTTPFTKVLFYRQGTLLKEARLFSQASVFLSRWTTLQDDTIVSIFAIS